MIKKESFIRKTHLASRLWKGFLRHTEAKLAFKIGLGSSLSLILGLSFAKFFDRPDTLVSGLWCVLAAIVVMQANLGGTYLSAGIRFLGVVVGSIAGGIFINILGNDPLSLGISVFCTIIICALLNLKDSFRIAALSTAIIIIMGSQHPMINPWIFGLYRFLDSCIGIIVALFVSRFIFPAKAIEGIKQNLAKILNLLGRYYLVTTRFEVDAALNLTTHEFFEEIDDLLQENKDNRKAAELELLDQQPKMQYWTLLSESIEEIFETINSLNYVNKETVAKIFDDNLAICVQNLIDKTNVALKTIEKMILEVSSTGNLDTLKTAIDEMSEELIRFRETRKTRKFNIEDVENFYFYFYSLRSIGNDTIKMSRQISESSE